jgi:hypothetical protein
MKTIALLSVSLAALGSALAAPAAATYGDVVMTPVQVTASRIHSSTTKLAALKSSGSADKSTASAGSPTSSAADKLALVVNVPASMRPFRDEDVARALADDVLAEFQRDGFKGQLDCDFADPETPRTDLPRLELNLVEWRWDPTHMIQCTFLATLVTPKGLTDLGLFSGTNLILSGLRDPFERADGFDGAARDAINDLYRKLNAQNVFTSAAANNHAAKPAAS